MRRFLREYFGENPGSSRECGRAGREAPLPESGTLLLSREYTRLQGATLAPSSVVSVLRLSGPVDPGRMEQALHSLVARHPALRTAVHPSTAISSEQRAAELAEFAETGIFRSGLYLQSIADSAHVVFHVTQGPVTHVSELQKLIATEVAQEFDLTQPPLIQARLARMKTGEHLLILGVDHLVADAWSMSLIRRELAAFISGIPLEPPPPASDYATWQHVMIEEGGFSPSLEYWQQQWRDFGPARLGFDDFPFRLERPHHSTDRFDSVRGSFDNQQSGTIRAFARKSRITLYTLFLASFSRLLHRYSGNSKLGLWGHFANRLRPEDRDAVGWFAHTHLLGIDLGAHPADREFLLHCREVVGNAVQHQATPVMQVWRALGGYPRSNVLDAKVLLDLSLADEPLPQGNGLVIEHAPELSPLAGRFAGLGLYIRDNRDILSLSVQYLEERFPKTAIEQLLVDFKQEVAGFLAAGS